MIATSAAGQADLPQPAAWRALFLLLDADNDGRLSGTAMLV